MIICSAFLPIYRRLGMNPLVLAAIATMALGCISGTTPWGGAATRGISVLHLDAGEYFVHMIGPMALTSLAIVAVSYWLDLRERAKLDPEKLQAYQLEVASGEAIPKGEVTWRIWANAALTLALMVLLILEVADFVVLFMVAFVIALLLNIRTIEEQQELIKRQAANAVPVMMLVLAAGIFTGIMTDAGMIKAMANAGVHADEIARAGAIGQILHSVGPASAPLWVLLGRVKADLGDFQKTAPRWGIPASFACIAFALLTGAITVT